MPNDKPQRARGIRIARAAGAEQRIARARNRRVRLLLDFILFLRNFAHRARFRIDQPRQFNHRIIRGGHRARAALVKFFAKSHVAHFRGR